jgi:two-component system sensor histidine kinase AlgZ
MHPLFANKTGLLLYLVLWIPFGATLAYLVSVTGGLPWREAASITAPLAAIYAFVCLSAWYLCRYLPLGAARVPSLVLNHGAAAIMAALLWVIAAKGLSILLERVFAGLDRRFSHQLPLLFAIGLQLYLLAVAVHYILLGLERSREAERLAQEAVLAAREAELRALKAQINPHFLFNSLNSISALATMDGLRARDMCLALSDFLRRTLSLGEKEMIPLTDEVGMAQLYLSVEKIRFGARLRFETRVDRECAVCQVPPLILQPLIENAVKHGVAGMVEGGSITLEARCGNGWLKITVDNDFDPEAQAASRTGIGLENVRSRLRARYAGEASLRASASEGTYRAELVLPCPSHGRRAAEVSPS